MIERGKLCIHPRFGRKQKITDALTEICTIHLTNIQKLICLIALRSNLIQQIAIIFHLYI